MKSEAEIQKYLDSCLEELKHATAQLLNSTTLDELVENRLVHEHWEAKALAIRYVLTGREDSPQTSITAFTVELNQSEPIQESEPDSPKLSVARSAVPFTIAEAELLEELGQLPEESDDVGRT